jgi:hypothetical protein
MRTTANIAAVGGYGYTDYAAAAKTAKNIALFAAAPFIGLAYAVAFPFVAVGMLAWYGMRALRNRAGTA